MIVIFLLFATVNFKWFLLLEANLSEYCWKWWNYTTKWLWEDRIIRYWRVYTFGRAFRNQYWPFDCSLRRWFGQCSCMEFGYFESGKDTMCYTWSSQPKKCNCTSFVFFTVRERFDFLRWWRNYLVIPIKLRVKYNEITLPLFLLCSSFLNQKQEFIHCLCLKKSHETNACSLEFFSLWLCCFATR